MRRTGELCAELDVPGQPFARETLGPKGMPHDGRQAWPRLTSEQTVSSDVRTPASR
ncbi:hypothetical protein GCM10022384_47120 [Streptomyces marokkonensis]|uniref:Uncharacterized protein n=1 Tax=Streptomyces marokkonensis TaxID=324855 RepID=A0ABP7R8L1_9ACTN